MYKNKCLRFSIDHKHIFVYSIEKEQMFSGWQRKGRKAMTRKKNIRIKSKWRFITFVVVLFLSVGIGFSSITGLNVVNGSTKPQYETVQVCAGDTLWDIAGRYTTDKQDVREVVYQIREVNQLASTSLTEGQTIKVPVQ